MKFAKFLFFFIFLSNNFIYSQNDSLKTNCDEILQKAKEKYGIIFNYSSQDLKAIDCSFELPPDYKSFVNLMRLEYGLNFNNFSDSLWVVSKKYTHKLKILNIENKPVMGAFILDQNKFSNSLGNIFINLRDEKDQFTISNFNYEDFIITITEESDTNLIIKLQPKQINLKEVNLKPLYTNSIFLNRNNHINVKIKNMPLLAGQTQQDAFVSLLNLPQINTNVESVGELNIRGGINDQNLVLWNGIRMFQNTHFFGLLSAFNENLIEDIVVIDNSTPVEYGNALTGTIALNFDENLISKNRVGVGLNALSGQVFSRVRLNKTTEFSAAFQRSFTDVLNTPTFNSYSEKAFEDTDLDLLENTQLSNSIRREDDFYYQDAQFQIKKKINDKLRVNVYGLWSENTLEYKEIDVDESFRNSDYNNVNVAIGADANLKLNNTDRLKIKSNYSKHESKGRNNTFSGNLDTNQSNSVENYITQFIWQRATKQSSLTLGADFEGSVVFNKFDNTVSEAFLNLGQVSNVYSGFASYNFSSGKWFFYAGVRNVFYQRDKQFRVEPRLQLDYKLNKNLNLVLRGEVKSQNFKQIIDLDQNFLGIEKRRWVVSGDTISPPLQRTSQLETMFKWKFNKIGGYASVYYRELKGISSNDQQFQNEGQFQELIDGNSQILGTIFHMYFKNNWLNTWLSYSHISEKFFFNDVSFRGNNSLNHQIIWGSNLKYKNWNFSFAVNYHSGLPFTRVDEDNPIIEQPPLNSINFKKANTNTLPEYFRLDSSLQFKLKTNTCGNFTFSLGIINLTDKNNFLRRNYRLNRVNQSEIQQIDNVGLGFTPNLGILWIL